MDEKKGGPAKKRLLTLHLPTVKTYVKKRDLQLDLKLTEIDKREEGEIAGEEWRKGGSFKSLFLGPCNTERTVTGMSSF